MVEPLDVGEWPLAQVLARTSSWLAPVVRHRRASGDTPAPTCKVFVLVDRAFAVVIFPKTVGSRPATDPRWLLLPLD